MTLADSSVWVDHLRKGSGALSALLEEGQVLCHPFVIGELACGNMKSRNQILALLTALPSATVAAHDEALRFLSQHKLHGKGLGWVDVHLLASSLLTGCSLWTRDKALVAAARALKIDA